MNDDNEIIKTAEFLPSSAIESQTKAEYDISIATAHRFPRSIDGFLKRAHAA